MRRLGALAVVLVGLAGCDTLFPEFSGKPPADMATGDGGADGGSDGGSSTPHLAGVVCVLADLRDYRSCANGVPGVMRVTVEETRDVGMTDASGHFTLPLTRKLDVATVAAVDPLGRYAPSIIPLYLSNGVLDGVALPIVDQSVLANAAVANGMSLDASRGTVLGWAINAAGTPVSNVASNPMIYTDGAAPNQLFLALSTGPLGTVALFNVAAPTVTVTLAPAPSSQLATDQFSLPVRPNAVTMSRIVLLPSH
jgi:hypothetical protein